MTDCSANIPLDQLATGYPKLAGQMALLPETAIVRKFNALNFQSLLYQQAEIQHLEHLLRKAESEDSKSSVGRKSLYSTNWYWLSQSPENDNKQLELFRRIQKCLKVYNKNMYYVTAIQRLESDPSKHDLNDLQHYLASKEMGPFCFTGSDHTIWGNIKKPWAHCPDLISLKPRAPSDRFSSLIMNSLPTWFNISRFKKANKTHGMIAVADELLLRVTRAVTTLVASTLSIAAIAVLYNLQSMPARLGLIAAFNLVTCLSLILFTEAKRQEIFAISAAFSAVQVVFVSVNDPSGNGGCGC